MIELFLNSIIYSFCIFVPLLALYAVIMISTGRWIVVIESDPVIDCESCDHFPMLLKEQAD